MSKYYDDIYDYVDSIEEKLDRITSYNNRSKEHQIKILCFDDDSVKNFLYAYDAVDDFVKDSRRIIPVYEDNKEYDLEDIPDKEMLDYIAVHEDLNDKFKNFCGVDVANEEYEIIYKY